uniref:BPTI-like C-terminal domain-containing protein n=1 Tax=Meloidogyne javanica TaxID=6303 RepID=A0A915LMM1_MELJA
MYTYSNVFEPEPKVYEFELSEQLEKKWKCGIEKGISMFLSDNQESIYSFSYELTKEDEIGSLFYSREDFREDLREDFREYLREDFRVDSENLTKLYNHLIELCACPIGSPARGCDPMPFVLWHDLIVNGCPNVTVNTRDPAQKVHRWFRRPYIFPYCSELDFNLWRSPRTKQECELYCYSSEEQRKRGGSNVV